MIYPTRPKENCCFNDVHVTTECLFWNITLFQNWTINETCLIANNL